MQRRNEWRFGGVSRYELMQKRLPSCDRYSLLKHRMFRIALFCFSMTGPPTYKLVQHRSQQTSSAAEAASKATRTAYRSIFHLTESRMKTSSIGRYIKCFIPGRTSGSDERHLYSTAWRGHGRGVSIQHCAPRPAGQTARVMGSSRARRDVETGRVVIKLVIGYSKRKPASRALGQDTRA